MEDFSEAVRAVDPRSMSAKPALERIRAEYVAVGLLDDALLDEDLWRAAREQPNAVFISDNQGFHTYAQVRADVLGLAGMFVDLGVGVGDVVSFHLPNRVEAAVTYFAALAVGAVCNPISPIYRERELGFVLHQARPKVSVVVAAYRGVDFLELHARAAQIAGYQPTLIAVDCEGTSLDYTKAVAHTPVDPLPPRKAENRAVLLYTSGTTADPKGVLHSHQSLRAECKTFIGQCGLVSSDTAFMASPVAHITGLLYGIQTPALLGGASVLQETWEPGVADQLIRKAGCTFTVGATPFLHGLVDTAEQTNGSTPLRVFVCGGADVPGELVLRAKAILGLDVVRAYGLTEAPTITCGSLSDRIEKRAATDGRPPCGTQVRVLGGDGVTRTTGAGELEARAPEMFLGYLDPRLDKEAFCTDGWLRTGDLAVVDADGYVTIQGRSKDIIVRGGENISAKEVEDLLFEHPAIFEVAVVGYPDPVMGQRMCAFIVLAQSAASPTLSELAAFLDARGLARQKTPERVEILDVLPKTPSGKIQKNLLRDLAEGREAPL